MIIRIQQCWHHSFHAAPGWRISKEVDASPEPEMGSTMALELFPKSERAQKENKAQSLESPSLRFKSWPCLSEHYGSCLHNLFGSKVPYT